MTDREWLIEPWPPREKGGQHVGTGPHGVRVTHTLTGLSAASDAHRSQHKNRELAMSMVEWGLANLK